MRTDDGQCICAPGYHGSDCLPTCTPSDVPYAGCIVFWNLELIPDLVCRNISLLTGVPCDIYDENFNAITMEETGEIVLSNNTFARFSELSILLLKRNGLTSVESSLLSYNYNLKHVDLAHNRLATLPKDLFAYNVQLTNLDLSYNAITLLPTGLFAHNAKLEFIDLRNNVLSMLPSSIFESMSMLSTLLLAHNKLTTMDFHSLRSNSALSTLFVSFSHLLSLLFV